MEDTVAHSYQSGTYWLAVSAISMVLMILALAVLFCVLGWEPWDSISSTVDGDILRAALNRRPRTYLPFAKGTIHL